MKILIRDRTKEEFFRTPISMFTKLKRARFMIRFLKWRVIVL